MFDSGDLIAAFQAGRYEQPAAGTGTSPLRRYGLEVRYVGVRPRTLINALDAMMADESERKKATAFAA